MSASTIPIISNYLKDIEKGSAELRQYCALFDKEPSQLRNLTAEEMETYAKGREVIMKMTERIMAITIEFSRVIKGQSNA